MTDKSSKTKTASLGWIFWAFVWGSIGYLVYGSLTGAVALALFSAVTNLTALFGLIPVVGVGITIVATNYVRSWILRYVAMSWAVSVIAWIALAGSMLLTIIVLLLILVKVIDR